MQYNIQEAKFIIKGYNKNNLRLISSYLQNKFKRYFEINQTIIFSWLVFKYINCLFICIHYINIQLVPKA